VGAAIVDKRRPISVGANLLKTHPVYADGKRWFSIHAEMKALISAATDVEGCDIYVYRAKANGWPGMARPCDECLKVLAEAGIRRVYYTTELGYKVESLDGETEARYLQLFPP
jgi:deoxycytidylate deaminase